MEKKIKFGVVYLAFGYEYLVMAIHSANSSKKHNPNISYELVTNISINKDNLNEFLPFNKIHFLDFDSKFNRHFKTKIIDYVSFDIGVFIDCDTEIYGSFEPIFESLKNFDIALKLNRSPSRKEYMIDDKINSFYFPYFNSGVIFFRKNDVTRTFFNKWNENFLADKKGTDQPSLAKSIYETEGIRILPLNGVWNTFLGSEIKVLKFKKISKESKKWLRYSVILHYRRPEDWPFVAKSLFKIHKILKDCVASSRCDIKFEINNLNRKYKIISSKFYLLFFNFPFFKKLLSFFLKILTNIGIFKYFELKRRSELSGERYKHSDFLDRM